MSKLNKKSLWWLVIGVVLTQGFGYLSSLIAGDIRGKYEMMNTPPFSPPGPVFGIAWTVLYLLMAIAAFLVFRSDASESVKRPALLLYVSQLVVNFAWSPIFFNGAMWLAVVVIIVLDILAVLTTLYFLKVEKIAGYLMIPYLLWLAFATYLAIGTAILT